MKTFKKADLQVDMLIDFEYLKNGIVKRRKDESLFVLFEDGSVVNLVCFNEDFKTTQPSMCNCKIKAIYDVPEIDENYMNFNFVSRKLLFECDDILESAMKHLNEQAEEVKRITGKLMK